LAGIGTTSKEAIGDGYLTLCWLHVLAFLSEAGKDHIVEPTTMGKGIRQAGGRMGRKGIVSNTEICMKCMAWLYSKLQ